MDVSDFSIEQLAGQRLMIGFDGTEFNSAIKSAIETLKVGGFILFSQNTAEPAQIRDLCAAIRTHCRRVLHPLPFIAIDQEGGAVARLNPPFTRFAGNPHMKGIEDAVHFASITATELLEVGINMNMAPVLDVASVDSGSIMAARSFGGDPQWCARLGAAVIDHLQSRGVMSVAKHFPGIGRTAQDSHIDLPCCDAEPALLKSSDLVPFEVGIQHGVCGVMISHIRYPKLDADWPASLSRRITKDLLRDQMGFGGITMTDDLDMGAIAGHFDIRTTIRQILAAEVDIALICHPSAAIEIAFKEIAKQLRDSESMRNRALESVGRIMHAKKTYLNI